MTVPQREFPDGQRRSSNWLGYFMVKVRRSGVEGWGGVVEQLGTGEKREFKSGEELARVVEEWSR